MANGKEVKNIQEAELQLNMSERFAHKVLAEFGVSATGALQITDYQRSLIQGYFIGIDRALKTAEEDRVRKNESNSEHKWDNPLAVIWNNVNMNDLALDVVHYARLGLDMMQPNHISPIPYRNKKTNKYDVNLMPGYNGIRYVAEKYALIRPKSVTIDLVYSNDHFKPIKKSFSHPIETYEFDIENAFDRGNTVGGFGYIEYDDAVRNELVIMTMRDIEKRKPEYASANFWGGTATEWKKGGKKETVEKAGWLDEMCRKTLIREVYSAKHIPRDPRKVDENYQYMKQQEARLQAVQEELREEINVTANTVPLKEIKEAVAPISKPIPAVYPTDTAAAVQAQPVTKKSMDAAASLYPQEMRQSEQPSYSQDMFAQAAIQHPQAAMAEEGPTF
jgi:recombination protein RecT